MSAVRAEDLITGITPFREPDARLAAAVSRAGGLGVLDLGDGGRQARDALGRLRRWAPGNFGVRWRDPAARIPEKSRVVATDPTVVIDAESTWQVGDVSAIHRVLVEVTDHEQALAAARAGADGLIARGAESGGRVGELSTFVLLQQLLMEAELDLPVWACGGIGPRTAAAAVAGGAAGGVPDSQPALLADSNLPETTAAALRAMDGPETVVVAGNRVLRPPKDVGRKYRAPASCQWARTASSPRGSPSEGAMCGAL